MIPMNAFEFEDFKQYLSHRIQSGVPTFTAAHQNSGLLRYTHTVNTLIQSLHKFTSELDQAADLQTCHKILCRLPSVGDFFAWQVLCDLMESNVLSHSEESFVVLGPGARKGIQIIFSCEELNANREKELEYTRFLRDFQQKAFNKLALDFPKFANQCGNAAVVKTNFLYFLYQ